MVSPTRVQEVLYELLSAYTTIVRDRFSFVNGLVSLAQGFPILAETARHLPPPTEKKMEMVAGAGAARTGNHLHQEIWGGGDWAARIGKPCRLS